VAVRTRQSYRRTTRVISAKLKHQRPQDHQLRTYGYQVDFLLLLIAVGLGPLVAAKNAATCEQRIAAAQT